jgi:hypothetical protein
MNRSGQLQRDVASGMKTIHTVASPLVKSIKELASAVGLLNKAWNGLKDAQKGGGIKGLFAGIPAAGFNLAKQGLELNLFPELALRDAFRDRRTPGVVTSQARSFRHTGQLVPTAFQHLTFRLEFSQLPNTLPIRSRDSSPASRSSSSSRRPSSCRKPTRSRRPRPLLPGELRTMSRQREMSSPGSGV